MAPDILAGAPTAGHRTGDNGGTQRRHGRDGRGRGRGSGQAGAPPPPPATARGARRWRAASPAARRAARRPAPAGLGRARPAPPAGPQGWVPPGEVPAAWGAASPSAQVGWDRPPSGNNGCLKACLIVGGILVVLVIVGGDRGLESSPAARRASGSTRRARSAAVPAHVQRRAQQALGRRRRGAPARGLRRRHDRRDARQADAPDATDCWILATSGTTGRSPWSTRTPRRCSGNSRAEAEASFSTATSTDRRRGVLHGHRPSRARGVLVRFGDRVVYVRMVAETRSTTRRCATTAHVIARTLEP